MTSTQAIGAILLGWPKPTLHGNTTTSVLPLLRGQETLCGNKYNFWLSRCHTRPCSRQKTFNLADPSPCQQQGTEQKCCTGDILWIRPVSDTRNSNAFISIFTAYRSCSGSIWTMSIGSTFSHEYQHLRWSNNLSHQDHGPRSNPRGLFADINPNTIPGQPLTTQDICQPCSTPLKSGNPEFVEPYHKAVHKNYADHNMV